MFNNQLMLKSIIFNKLIHQANQAAWSAALLAGSGARNTVERSQQSHYMPTSSSAPIEFGASTTFSYKTLASAFLDRTTMDRTTGNLRNTEKRGFQDRREFWMSVHSAHHFQKCKHMHKHMCIHFEWWEAIRVLTPAPCLHFHLAVHLLVRCPYLCLKKIRI